jgi:hypothetical protein
MKKQNSKKLFLNKKMVSVLRANEMAALKGGLGANEGIQSRTISCFICDWVTKSFIICDYNAAR